MKIPTSWQDYIEKRVTKLEKQFDQLNAEKPSTTLLALPDHLRKTAVALLKQSNYASAYQVSEQTKRCRAVESGYLNQLVLIGCALKERCGRKVYFSIKEEHR